MAISLLFGVLVSTLLTLVVIPLGCVSAGRHLVRHWPLTAGEHASRLWRLPLLPDRRQRRREPRRLRHRRGLECRPPAPRLARRLLRQRQRPGGPPS